MCLSWWIVIKHPSSSIIPADIDISKSNNLITTIYHLIQTVCIDPHQLSSKRHLQEKKVQLHANAKLAVLKWLSWWHLMMCRCAAGPSAMTTACFSESHSEFLIVKVFTCNYILWKSNYNLNQHFWLRVTERTIRSLRAGPDDGAVVEEEVIAKATSWRLKESADRRVKVTWGRRFLSEHTPVVMYELSSSREPEQQKRSATSCLKCQ